MIRQGPELQGQATARSMCPEEGKALLLPQQVNIPQFVQQILMRLFSVGGTRVLSMGICPQTTRERRSQATYSLGLAHTN